MTINVEVTQEDIDKGMRTDCYRCPIARAINRSAAGFMADVTSSLIRLFPQPYLGTYFRSEKMPHEVSHFIARFDRGNLFEVKPFTFTLDLVEQPDEDDFSE